jgi:hypothetical protein
MTIQDIAHARIEDVRETAPDMDQWVQTIVHRHDAQHEIERKLRRLVAGRDADMSPMQYLDANVDALRQIMRSMRSLLETRNQESVQENVDGMAVDKPSYFTRQPSWCEWSAFRDATDEMGEDFDVGLVKIVRLYHSIMDVILGGEHIALSRPDEQGRRVIAAAITLRVRRTIPVGEVDGIAVDETLWRLTGYDRGGRVGVLLVDRDGAIRMYVGGYMADGYTFAPLGVAAGAVAEVLRSGAAADTLRIDGIGEDGTRACAYLVRIGPADGETEEMVAARFTATLLRGEPVATEDEIGAAFGRLADADAADAARTRLTYALQEAYEEFARQWEPTHS